MRDQHQVKPDLIEQLAIAHSQKRHAQPDGSEFEYQALLAASIDASLLCNAQGQILGANDAVCHLLGYCRDELLTLSISDLEVIEEGGELARNVQPAIERGRARFESCLRGKDGRTLDVEIGVGRVQSAGETLFVFLRERAGRRQLEQEMQQAHDELELRVQQRTADLEQGRERERVLNALLRLSMEEISLEEQLERALDEILSIPWLPVQPRGGIFLIPDSARAQEGVLELRAQRGFDRDSQLVCSRVSVGHCLCGKAAAGRQLLFAGVGDERHEIAHKEPDRHSHYCVPILSGGTPIGIITLYLDPGHRRDARQEEFLEAIAHTLAGLIKRKRVEEALQQREQQLYELNEQLEAYGRELERKVADRTREIEALHRIAEEAAVAKERQRLARDLHDSVTQSLYSITLLAEGWQRLSQSGRLDDTEEPLRELGAIAQQALKEMRLMVHELRPPDLEKVGLLGALHQRLGAVEKRAGVDARLVADEAVELPPRVEEGLYWIAIEALNNALKHAEATSVTIRIWLDERCTGLEVADNGCGFDTGAIDGRRGMGLQSMLERAAQMGGTLHIDSAPLQGTSVRVSLENC